MPAAPPLLTAPRVKEACVTAWKVLLQSCDAVYGGPHQESCLCNLTMACLQDIIDLQGWNSRASQASRSDCINKYIHNEEGALRIARLAPKRQESLQRSWRTNHSRLDETMNCVWCEQQQQMEPQRRRDEPKPGLT